MPAIFFDREPSEPLKDIDPVSLQLRQILDELRHCARSAALVTLSRRRGSLNCWPDTAPCCREFPKMLKPSSLNICYEESLLARQKTFEANYIFHAIEHWRSSPTLPSG